MAYGQQDPGGREQPPGVELARLLRRWWEEAGNSPGGMRPTQQALAKRAGVDQTTLSRYLNPKHTSSAPPRVVQTLHAQLRAPAAELERALALCRTVQEENNRHRTPGAKQTPAPAAGPAAVTGPGHPHRRDTPPVTAPDTAPGTALGTALGTPGAAGTNEGGPPARPRSRRALPLLMLAAVILAFVAGMGTHRLVATGRDVTAAGAAGAVPAGEVPPEWPLLLMAKEDQYSRGRALQHLLNAHGYKVRADGFFGKETRDAVMDFQRRHHLPSDGKVGRKTWPELVKRAGPGDRGPHVLALQELLDNVGQGGTVVSGTFSAVTEEDLEFFQRTCHLPVTGRADPETWLFLLARQRPPVRSPAYQTSTSLPGPTSA
ncbi:peptidoglycan-binding protein [Streptomyces sp. JHA26]|uniref:peptidoglycan-binding protein n=1 Tax=Streptomyces sp. JHA26 TaxID=1917143 RepID=UPI00098A5BAF|nr:peptidoglycan-binding protein [Streptomyces sp. JHA26]